MKLTKRLICLMLVLALTFALCACGKDKEEKDDSATTNPGGFSTQPSTQTTVDPWDGGLEGDVHFNDATLAW